MASISHLSSRATPLHSSPFLPPPPPTTAVLLRFPSKTAPLAASLLQNGSHVKRTTLHDLYEKQGQSPWYDNLCRPVTDLIPLIESGVRGVTSNPTIFQKAISTSTAYNDQFMYSLGSLNNHNSIPGPALWAGQPGQTPRPKRFIGPDENLGSRFLNKHCYIKCLINDFSNKDETSSMVKILKFALGGKDIESAYWELVVKDIQDACRLFEPIYDETDGGDGYVSVEVSPWLADDTQGTVDAAKWLHKVVDRPNVHIKIPATTTCVPSIKEVISFGISVNVTVS
ncbi:putative transaldolase [Helianthus anomalus]